MPVVAEDSSVRIERLELGPYGTNAYIVVSGKTQASVLVDVPDSPEVILSALKGTQPAYILLTHGHSDHTGALRAVHDALKVPLAAHPADSQYLPVKPDILLADGDIITPGDLKIGVLHTPGHTPGSLCFWLGKYLLSGDTIFPGGPGRTRSPGAFRLIVKSLKEKIFVLPDDTRIFPGHGLDTVLRKEKGEFAVFASRPPSPDNCGDVLWLSP